MGDTPEPVIVPVNIIRGRPCFDVTPRTHRPYTARTGVFTLIKKDDMSAAVQASNARRSEGQGNAPKDVHAKSWSRKSA